MTTLKDVCILLCVTCYLYTCDADKYTDENRPYEFGFTIDGEQHRHEKKDENGIIMGEFGFITADGVYHVTVYATDENGNFKILSMKNIRVKPYPTAPGVGERKSASIPIKENQKVVNPAPSVGARQGHSISLAPPQQATSNNKQQINKDNQSEIVRSCSHCKVPTTTAAPRIETTTDKKQIYPNNISGPEISLRSPFANEFPSSISNLNTHSAVSVNSNGQTYVSFDQYNPSNLSNKNSENQQTITMNNQIVPNSEPSIYDNSKSNEPTYPPYTNRKSNYEPNLLTGENLQPNINPESAYPKSIEGTNGQVQGGSEFNLPNRFNIPDKNLQVPTTDQNISEPSIYDNNKSNEPTYPQYTNRKSNYEPNLSTVENVQPNFNPEPVYPKSIEETNGHVQGASEFNLPDRFNIPDKNLQVPTIDQNISSSPYGDEPKSFNSKENENGQNFNEVGQIVGAVGSPPSIPNVYRQPKSFEDILQSASPSQGLLDSSQTGASQIPKKPVLIAAQMQIVDKNTDIYQKNPGEIDGLPKGVNTGDVADLLYTFNYTVGFHGHHEKGYRNGVKVGYYYVTGRNGVRTRVDYEADEKGFRPKITQEVLDILSEEVPKPETEKDEKYGLKGYEFKWLYYPVESRKR